MDKPLKLHLDTQFVSTATCSEILRESLNINTAYIKNMDGLLNALKIVRKMSADGIKLFCGSG
jgi:hypothetical protein